MRYHKSNNQPTVFLCLHHAQVWSAALYLVAVASLDWPTGGWLQPARLAIDHRRPSGVSGS